MRIREVDIKNFRGYGENPNETDKFYKFTDLDRADIVLITGHNGYGKSSLYEAIEWCLTDNIRALKKHTEDTNIKSTLKKSHYLKFQSTFDKRPREVAVQIIFDDGSALLRKTMCDSLHQDNYQSVLTDEREVKIGNDKVNELIKDKTNQPLEKFFRLNFFGQAFSEDLIQDTAARKRGEILLSFLGMNTISKIIEMSDGQTNQTLSKKQKDVEGIINGGKDAKNKLDVLFQVNHLGSVETYYEQIGHEIDVANEFQSELKKENMHEDFQFKGDTLTEIIETMQKCKLLKERFEKSFEADCRQRDFCIKERLIRENKKNQVFLTRAGIVKGTNIIELQENLERLQKKEELYNNTIDELTEKKTEINYNLSLPRPENENVLFLTEEDVNRFEKKKEQYRKLYSEGLNYGLTLQKNVESVNVKRLFKNSNIYRNSIAIHDAVLEEKREMLKTLEGICGKQREILLKVQTFVNESETIERCPVCGSTDFIVEGEEAKDKLLSIIGDKISDGDENLKRYNEEIILQESRLLRFKRSYEEYVWNKYILGTAELDKGINNCVQKISQYLEEMIECNHKAKNSVHIKNEELQHKCEEYTNFAQEYDIKESLIESKIKQAEEWNQRIKRCLLEKFQIDPDGIERTDNDVQVKIRPIIKRIYLEQKVINMLSNILRYDLGKENIRLLEDFERASSEIETLEEKKGLYLEALRFRKNVSDAAKDIKKEMMEKYIESNDLINIIYQYINPHPFFRSVRIEQGKTETNIKASEKDGIFLDHVLSEAQRKVLSLSIFLGLNLSVRSNSFEQIYIDDPVQSMDDINMVSFIDLLRALKTSKRINRNYIIGTHDDNFSKLLMIKFRHRSFIEYRLTSYFKEGPIIDVRKSVH